MKKYFQLAAIAVVALALTVACKSKPAEEPIDTTPVVEEIVDTVVEEVAEEVVEEVVEPVKQAAKKVEKKAEKQLTETKEATMDTKANAQGRMAQKEAAKMNLTEAKAEKGETNAPDVKKNAENRMKKR